MFFIYFKVFNIHQYPSIFFMCLPFCRSFTKFKAGGRFVCDPTANGRSRHRCFAPRELRCDTRHHSWGVRSQTLVLWGKCIEFLKLSRPVCCTAVLQAPCEESRESPDRIAENHEPQPVALPLSSGTQADRYLPVTEPEAEPDSSDSDGWTMPSPGGMHSRIVKPKKTGWVVQTFSSVWRTVLYVEFASVPLMYTVPMHSNSIQFNPI